MKNTTIMCIVIAAVFLAAGRTSAQDNKLKLELSYNISVPLGSFKNDFINKPSFRGGTGELSYAVNPKLALGLSSGFQSYYQKYGRQTYKLNGNQVVSAVLTNSMDITPLLLRGTYFPLGASSTARLLPYVSAGAGINLVSYRQYLGEFGSSTMSTPFAAQAGAGIQIPFGKRINQNAFKIGATYNYVDYNRNDIGKLNNLGASAGVVFALK